MLTRHAKIRAAQRGISLETIHAVLNYGSCHHDHGADHYLLGWREVEFHANHGVDLKLFEGYCVVCTPTGEVMTVYRYPRPRHRRPRLHPRSSRQRVSFKAGSDSLLQSIDVYTCL